MKITVESSSEKRLKETLNGMGQNVRKHLKVIVNKTSKRTQNFVAKEIREEIIITANGAKKAVRLTSQATEASLVSTVEVPKEDRIPLREFKPRQNRKGVSYRLSRNEGKKEIKSAFIVSTLGGHVFVRIGPKRPSTKGRYKGQMRQKIVKLQGPSVYRIVSTDERMKRIENFVSDEIVKQTNERIRFLSLSPRE
jgi:hypothetical protein